VYGQIGGKLTFENFSGVSVIATAMQHSMKCVGFCVDEAKGEDRLRVDLVGGISQNSARY